MVMTRPTRGIGPDVKAEAATWLARLHADDRTLADEKAFRAWLAARSEHARAFEAVTTLWEEADGLRLEDATGHVARPFFRRRTVLAGLGAAVAASAGFTVWQEAYAGVYETGIGEQRHVVLSDGTLVFLDTDTRIREHFTDTLRIVDIERGRANFRVRPDAGRPFVVEANGQRIVADRTALDVRRDAGRLSVVLLEGRATVLATARTAGRRLELSRGERVVVSPNIAVRIDRPNLAPLTAWQTGQAMFEGDTLVAAAAEMNRYSIVRLVIDDAAIANMKLSGVYRVGDNEAFARSVAQLLPVSIEHYPDHIELVRDESRMPEG